MFKKNNLKHFKKASIFLSALAFFAFCFFCPLSAQVQEELENKESKLTVILRDSDGYYIPDLNFEIYTQVSDADGLPKPGKKISGGKINSYTGKGEVVFEDNNEYYVLKTWDKNNEAGAFYFYDIYVYDDEIEINEVLSSIEFVFRDTEDVLLKNIDFSLFTQKEDTDANPIKEPGGLIAEFNTADDGKSVAYVPSGDRSLSGGDYYLMEVDKKGSEKYILYDIAVYDSNKTEIDYIFSDMKLSLKDANDISFPANIKIEIFKQIENNDGEKVLGTKIKDIFSNDKGEAVFKNPEGLYAARIMGELKQYQIFWDLEIEDQTRSNYELSTNPDWIPEAGACEAESVFELVVRNVNDDYIPGLNYELYEQVKDINGNNSAGSKILEGVVNEYGKGKSVFNPDPRKTYALKIYDKNPEVGEFWFFDEVQLNCGDDILLDKRLSSLTIVLRDGDGNLAKNHQFSIYTQKHDADGKPIKEKKDLIYSKFSTSEKGKALIYLSPDHPYDSNKKGKYIFSFQTDKNIEYNEYDINISEEEDYFLEYTISDLVVTFENALKKPLEKEKIYLYEQQRQYGTDYSLGEMLQNSESDINGKTYFQYPSGRYAILVEDSLGKDNVFWNVYIKSRIRNYENIEVNTTRVRVKDEGGNYLGAGASVSVYSMKEDENGLFFKDKSLKKYKIQASGNLDLNLSPNPYLITSKKDKEEYGQAFYSENGKLQEVTIFIGKQNRIIDGQKFKLEKPSRPISLAERLKGKILLQVESRGEAWYVDTKNIQRYYLKDGEAAYNIMKELGLGITNSDLKKIPIGLDARFEEFDYDGDMVPDKLEEAIGTDMYLADSDGDGYPDGVEIEAGYNPLGEEKMQFDLEFSEKLKGKILLQVESRGEAWYVNPSNGKRYYMSNGDSAYEIMRFLSLGITDVDLNKIEPGYINIE